LTGTLRLRAGRFAAERRRDRTSNIIANEDSRVLAADRSAALMSLRG